MAMHCVTCGGIVPDLNSGGVFSGCESHIKPEVNLPFKQGILKRVEG